jgi:hypothetical protein
MDRYGLNRAVSPQEKQKQPNQGWKNGKRRVRRPAILGARPKGLGHPLNFVPAAKPEISVEMILPGPPLSQLVRTTRASLVAAHLQIPPTTGSGVLAPGIRC